VLTDFIEAEVLTDFIEAEVLTDFIEADMRLEETYHLCNLVIYKFCSGILVVKK